jgi:hypothetical protein
MKGFLKGLFTWVGGIVFLGLAMTAVKMALTDKVTEHHHTEWVIALVMLVISGIFFWIAPGGSNSASTRKADKDLASWM